MSINNNSTNTVTPATAEHSNSRENKDAKRARMQQTLNIFHGPEQKQAGHIPTQCGDSSSGKRLWTDKRLVPSGLRARLRKEKAEKAREEAERADEK